MVEPDIVELIESPCAQIVGTVDADGLPDATRGWGAQVLDDGTKIRLLLAANAATSIRNLRSTRRIAFTATHFLTLHSVQVKGIALTVDEATETDRGRYEEFCAGCVRMLEEMDGTPESLSRRFVPSGIVVCVLTVDELFDQTPGPGAGKCLTATKAKP